MAFWGDYHTHTVFSHGKGTIEENVVSAINKGLKEIAITDHGFRHLTFNVSRSGYKQMREEVTALREKYPQINIRLGVEANIRSYDGKVDVTDDDVADLDIMVCGYHKLVLPKYPKEFFTFFLNNLIKGESKSDVKRMVRNTDAYLKMLENYEVDIVSHINYGISADALEIARACRHFGTLVELNGKRINITDKELEIMASEGVNFICDSDAHSPLRVGDFSLPLETIERLHLPYELIANWEKLPTFRSEKNRK